MHLASRFDPLGGARIEGHDLVEEAIGQVEILLFGTRIVGVVGSRPRLRSLGEQGLDARIDVEEGIGTGTADDRI